MSAPNNQAGGSFSPPAKLTVDQYKELALFFRDFLADKPVITSSIILAGIGGLLEALHVVWLVLRYVFRF
jgi:hypothetical protein